MKKTTKSILAKSLAVAMAFSLVGIASGVDAEAAAKPSVTKKVSVKVGKTKTVKVTSKKAVKKTTWSLTKAGKKVVTLSKKAKKSVTVKGKKAGKATLTAKVKVGSKTYKLTSKITVTKASKKTATPDKTPGANTPKPDDSKEPTVTPEPEKPVQLGNTGKTYLESQNYSVNVTELNETTFTCLSKRPEGSDPVADDTIYTKDGVSFTSRGDYNSGVSFYVNPCTDEKDIVDISETRGEGFSGFQNGTKDMSDYDYIRVNLTSDNEMNLRTYNGNDQLESAGFPGSSTSETYEGGWIGPAEGYMESDGGTGMKVKDEYVTRTIYISIADLIAKGCDPATLTAIAFCPQRGGTEVTIHSIDFIKVNVDVPVTSIAVTANKTAIENKKVATCTAAITPENASKTSVVWSSSDTNLATVDYNGQVTAAKEGSGKVTITATARDGSGVSGSVEITVGEAAEDPGEVKTHAVDLKADGVVAMSNIHPDTDENGNSTVAAEKTDAGLKFRTKCSMIYVNLKAYMDANKIDITNYKSVDIVWEVQDASGKAADVTFGWGKCAWVSEANLNGYSDGVGGSFDNSASETSTLDVATADTAALAGAAGFNIQVEGDKMPADANIIIKSITFNV